MGIPEKMGKIRKRESNRTCQLRKRDKHISLQLTSHYTDQFMQFVPDLLQHCFPRDGSQYRGLISSEFPTGQLVERQPKRRFECFQALMGLIPNAHAGYQVQPSRIILLIVRATEAVVASDFEAEIKWL